MVGHNVLSVRGFNHVWGECLSHVPVRSLPRLPEMFSYLQDMFSREMFENCLASDVSFIIATSEGHTEVMHAHRYVLISRNPVFRVMLLGALGDPGQEIRVCDVSPHAFREFLRSIMVFYIICTIYRAYMGAGHNLPDKSCVADTAMQIELA